MEKERTNFNRIAGIIIILFVILFIIPSGESIAKLDCNNDGEYETIDEDYESPDIPMAVSIEAHNEFKLESCKENFNNGSIVNPEDIQFKTVNKD